jgi:hypothetical protein
MVAGVDWGSERCLGESVGPGWEFRAKDPPRSLIPAHGDFVDWSASPDAARKFFAVQ